MGKRHMVPINTCKQSIHTHKIKSLKSKRVLFLYVILKEKTLLTLILTNRIIYKVAHVLIMEWLNKLISRA